MRHVALWAQQALRGKVWAEAGSEQQKSKVCWANRTSWMRCQDICQETLEVRRGCQKLWADCDCYQRYTDQHEGAYSARFKIPVRPRQRTVAHFLSYRERSPTPAKAVKDGTEAVA